MLTRVLWIIVKTSVALMTVTSALLLLVQPVEFCRLRSADKGKAIGVRVSWVDSICKSPNPNLNDDLRQVWELPMSVHLSQQMIDAGRCAVAVTKHNETASTTIDIDDCFYVNIWWVPVVIVVSLVNALVVLIDQMNPPITLAEEMLDIKLEFLEIFFVTLIWKIRFAFIENGEPYFDAWRFNMLLLAIVGLFQCVRYVLIRPIN